MVSKKIAIIVGVVVFFLSVGVSYVIFSNRLSLMLGGKKETATTISPTIDPESLEPKTQECPLNGQMMTEKQKNKWVVRRPLGIMIENHVEARPQSGISSADIVYEAVAEGGITRFMAIFYCQDAPFVGPVRSARVHFMTMLREYGDYPLYAHVGGANCDAETGSGCANGAKADALGIINRIGWGAYNDMNQFSVPFPYYWRDYERLPNVATEHTVYSSTTKLWDYAKAKRKLTQVDEEGISWDKTFTSWNFQDDAKPADRGTVSKVSFPFWDAFASDFTVTWKYDSKTNFYLRETGGKAHLDKNTGKQLQAKNVVIVFAKESPANDGYDGGHILYKLSGSGDALVFQNGTAIKATWTKKDEETRMKWYDESDKEISIVRGKVFVEILPIGNKVTY